MSADERCRRHRFVPAYNAPMSAIAKTSILGRSVKYGLVGSMAVLRVSRSRTCDARECVTGGRRCSAALRKIVLLVALSRRAFGHRSRPAPCRDYSSPLRVRRVVVRSASSPQSSPSQRALNCPLIVSRFGSRAGFKSNGAGERLRIRGGDFERTRSGHTARTADESNLLRCFRRRDDRVRAFFRIRRLERILEILLSDALWFVSDVWTFGLLGAQIRFHLLALLWRELVEQRFRQRRHAARLRRHRRFPQAGLHVQRLGVKRSWTQPARPRSTSQFETSS